MTPVDPQDSSERTVDDKPHRPAALLVGVVGLLIAVGAIATFALAGVLTSDDSTDSPAVGNQDHGSVSNPQIATAPLRSNEEFVSLGVPNDSYTPAAPNGGTDDYRCFLLDPELSTDATLAGVQVVPDNLELVHHAILYRVTPDQVADAKYLDTADRGPGWTCFGGSLVPPPAGSSALAELDDAPWLAAWAPGGKESVYPRGSGVEMPAGTQIVLQMHYNLRESQGVDSSSVRLRLSNITKGVSSVHTMLLPAPVELPCLPEETGRLCDRDNAVGDVISRFGEGSGRTIAGLQLLCDGDLRKPKAGNTQSCTRRMSEKTTIMAAAGHMHLLGQKISIDVNPGTPREKNILDIEKWDFDNQGAIPLKKPVELAAGDTVRVRCTHNPKLRSLLPSLAGTSPRYVLWGEGTTDEMCLGVLVTTHPE
ncbi:MAG: monooxygenase [Actinobacteria bacterium]|nr:monooxygenase [Actinomycetota bacterium]